MLNCRTIDVIDLREWIVLEGVSEIRTMKALIAKSPFLITHAR